MNYQEAVSYIHSFQKFGWILGRLERIASLLERLGSPQKRLRFIHVAGTNGKGSTTAMCSNILKAAGYRCGMYLSPYITNFRERFQINGEMISEADFVSLTETVKPVIEAMYQEEIMITEFEVITVIGILYFAQQACDFVALETGLGGGDDATNVIDPPLASVITSISLDHVAILGDTIAEIAGHKAGIIKNGSPVVCYALQHEDALPVLMERCAETGSPFILPSASSVRILESGLEGSRFSYGGTEYVVSLVGEHQVYNAVSVIEVMHLVNRAGFAVSDGAVQTGLSQTMIPARFQILRKNPYVVLDGAHNLESAQALSGTLSRISGKKVMIIGMLADKDYENALQLLCAQCDEIICVPVDNPRALSCQELCSAASRFGNAVSETNYEKAYHMALERAGDDGWVVICGSFYLAGSMLDIVE